MQILDVGCGTGSLLRQIKTREKSWIVRGVDPDENMIARAAKNSRAQNIDVLLDVGFGHDLPYRNAQFECVVSTLTFHHLDLAKKLATAREIRRVLRPGGYFLLADVGKPRNLWMRLAFLLVRCFDGFEATSPHGSGKIQAILEKSGFGQVEKMEEFDTCFGTMSVLKAS